MPYSNVIILGPLLEQRIAKMAISFKEKGLKVTVATERKAGFLSLTDLVVNDDKIEYIELSDCGRLGSWIPFGKIINNINNLFIQKIKPHDSTLVISRDIVYGLVAGRAISKLGIREVVHYIDIADNFDLYYDTQTAIKRQLFKCYFALIHRQAFKHCDGVIVVTPANKHRLLSSYQSLRLKNLIVLRNLPMKSFLPDKLSNTKEKNSIVYVGRIDEISRDPFPVMEFIRTNDEWTWHIYSNELKSTLDKLICYSVKYGIRERLVIHSVVPYESMHYEISRYTIGIVPHKRNLLTDYTVPNKLYDYKAAGLPVVMTDNPALVEENLTEHFGDIYHGDALTLSEAVSKAVSKLVSYAKGTDLDGILWEREFESAYVQLGG